jgi:[ribosomal protein S18]-alanine N-acetyltransferase
MRRMAATATLRLASTADAAAMARMSRDRVEAGLTWNYTPDRMAALIGDPAVSAVVARSGTRLQGLALMELGDEAAHLILVAVDLTVQRHGIGRRLMQWQIDTARAAGMERVSLELRADNEAGYGFYRHLGFEPAGRIDDYYDGIVAARRMVLALRAA